MSSTIRMRWALPLAVSALTAVTLATGSALLAGPAGAAPAVVVGAPTISGTATGPVGTSPDITLTYTITVTGQPLVDAILTASQPDGLPADENSVQVDGADAATGAAFVVDDVLSVGLGAGAGPSGGGELAVGTHTVTFTADASKAVNGSVDKASLSYGVGETRSDVNAADVPVPLPDLQVTTPPGSGEDGTLPLGSGQDGDFAVLVRNNGEAADSTLTVTLPPGLTVDEDYGVTVGEDEDDELDCSDSAPATVTCDLGRVTGVQQIVFIPVQAAADAPVGTVASFTVSAEADSGVDGNRSDNSVKGSVRYSGAAHLSIALAPASRHVAVGSSTTVRATVTNAGPQPAAGAVALLGVLTEKGVPSSKTFRITGFTGKQIDLGDFGGGSSGGSGPEAPTGVAQPVARSAALRQAYLHGSALAAPRRAAAPAQPVLAWDVDTLAANRSVSAVLTLKAVHVGSAYVVGITFADNDPGCFDDSPDADCTDLLRVRIDAVAAQHAPGGSSASPIASSGGVADTGAPTGQLTLLGLLALLVGTVLLRAGVIRHRGRHRAARRA